MLARPALTRRFADKNGHYRYGELPVLTERYNDFLPITPAVTIEAGPTREITATYQPWHSVTFAGADWIFDGMPPAISGDVLTGSAPSVILSPHVTSENVSLAVELKIPPFTQPKAEPVAIVFARTSTDEFFALQCSPGGRVSLHREGQKRKELAVAPRQLDFTTQGVALSLHTSNGQVVVTANGEPLLAWKSDAAFEPGRYGFESSLNTPPFFLRARPAKS